MQEEIWRDIPEYNGYQISNLGNVRTHNKISYTKRHGIRHWKDRILKFKSVDCSTGYRVDLWKNGKPKTFLVARLVAFTFYDKDINDHTLTVNHKDGNRLNNRLDNLELISLADNIRHAFNTGLMPYKKVKLTNKNNDYCQVFRSMSEASREMNKNTSYISDCLARGKCENDNFKWELF